VSFGPLHEVGRDVCLLEDVASDLSDAWTILTTFSAVTPGDVAHISDLRGRLQQVNEHLSRTEARMGRLVEEATR
jgi:hypothetical protein